MMLSFLKNNIHVAVKNYEAKRKSCKTKPTCKRTDTGMFPNGSPTHFRPALMGVAACPVMVLSWKHCLR